MSSQESESQETQYMSESQESLIELKLADTQTSEDAPVKNSPSLNEGTFAAPLSKSLQSNKTSNEDNISMTLSQNTIILSESDDTYNKSGNLSLSNDSPDFQNISNPSSAVLTPLSDDSKPGISSQDLFLTTSASNQGLSQRFVISSSTPRLRELSDTECPAQKKRKLDPDPDSSVEIISKTPDVSNLAAEMSVEEVPAEGAPALSGPSPNSGNTIILDASNTCASVPPTATESEFSLHYTQSASQLKELTSADVPKRSSSNSEILTNGSQDSQKTSWGSHNYEEFSYNSHCEAIKSPSKKLKLEQDKNLADTYRCEAGPISVVLKMVYSETVPNKLLALDIVDFSFHLEEGKEYRRASSSLSSGVLGDLSSGSSSLYSLPGPFKPRGRQACVSSTDSDQIKSDARKLQGANGKTHPSKLSPFPGLDRVPVRCSNCHFAFPQPQLFSSPTMNGTANGKGDLQIYVNSSGHIVTPDISSSSSQTHSGGLQSREQENRSSPQSPVTYQEIIRSRENPFGNLSVAFGFWSSFYFPCRILRCIADKFLVLFFDNEEKELTKNKLIPLSMLKPNSMIMVHVPSINSYTPGRLEEISDSPDHRSAPFAVFTQNELNYFSIESLGIAEQQRKVLIRNNNPQPATNLSSIDLDNCTSAKRNRTPRQSIISSLSSPRTVKSTAAKKLFRNAECKASTSEGKSPRNNKRAARKLLDEPKSYYSDSECDPKQYDLDLSGNGIRGVHLEKKDFNDPLCNLKQKKITSANDDTSLIEKYGPIPVKGSNLFAGFVFVLTYTDESISKPSFRTQTDSMTSESETDLDEFLKTEYPFSKSRLITQIKAGGGSYYENITHVPFNELKNTVLISNKPSLTCTYIYALAEGIRAYKHEDIIYCCVNSIPFRDYIQTQNYLPNGWSYSLVGYKEVPKMKPEEGSLRPQILKGKWILLLLDEKAKQECVDFWTAILEIAGARPRRGYAKVGSDESPVIAIADESLSKEMRERKDIKCVSVVWLIQSLINNQLMKAEGHPHYKYDFKSGRVDDSV
nr:PREDICTED: uncharacterized protein LOC109043071 [Bemisia tabaci]XP_018915655.1 PREDICTED: uncharacterized protein LOC109043071 [Bemisia tabaci]XP_018915656.1 PREDICTED: uncharacterized protein LOC109043071 [Bemisia tabaci]